MTPRPPRERDEVRRKARGRFDVDILGAERHRRLEDAPPFLFAARKAAALPRARGT